MIRRKLTLPVISSGIVLNRPNKTSPVSPANDTNNEDDQKMKTASSSFNESEELVYDSIDQNVVYSVHSLTKRYVYREPVSLNDPFEGFIDLHCVKHVRLGCLDAQTFIGLQQIAARYAISNLEHSNVICIVYGSTFSENRFIL